MGSEGKILQDCFYSETFFNCLFREKLKKPAIKAGFFAVQSATVRMKGLEPPCLAAIDPKSIASTNFATSA
jgi:hypothetical protein